MGTPIEPTVSPERLKLVCRDKMAPIAFPAHALRWEVPSCPHYARPTQRGASNGERRLAVSSESQWALGEARRWMCGAGVPDDDFVTSEFTNFRSRRGSLINDRARPSGSYG
jgi:hypothetical protein